MVSFRCGGDDWLVPVSATVGVRSGTDIRTLPSPASGVAGVLDVDGSAVPVVTALGAGGTVVTLLRAGGGTVGLVVDEVTGVVMVDDAAIAGPPTGQDAEMVGGVVQGEGGLTFVLAVEELARVTGPDREAVA